MLSVRLTPKGGRNMVDGIGQLADGGCVLKVRVRAAPIQGEANTALLRFVANVLDVPARDISLAAGASARIKRLMIAGDPAVLVARLAKVTESL